MLGLDPVAFWLAVAFALPCVTTGVFALIANRNVKRIEEEAAQREAELRATRRERGTALRVIGSHRAPSQRGRAA
jgi:heme exporter protein D